MHASVTVCTAVHTVHLLWPQAHHRTSKSYSHQRRAKSCNGRLNMDFCIHPVFLSDKSLSISLWQASSQEWRAKERMSTCVANFQRWDLTCFLF